jgi:hypothetical protein
MTAVLVLGSLTAGPVSAGTTIGSTFAPTVNCGSTVTYVQTTSPPGTSYTVQTRGVITSWRAQAGEVGPQITFKVFRPAGGNSYTVIGASAAVTLDSDTTTSRNIRVSVQPGDVIGETILSEGICSNASGSASYLVGDPALGSTATYEAGSGTLSLAAVLEADADADGYGDESQDGCPSQKSVQGPCDTVAPVSKFTAGPRRTTKAKAKFAFTSDDPAATFECRITGKKVRTIQLSTFQPCTSPAKYKHLKVGKYKVSVRATDAIGNVEAVPATVKLKVEKKQG